MKRVKSMFKIAENDKKYERVTKSGVFSTFFGLYAFILLSLDQLLLHLISKIILSLVQILLRINFWLPQLTKLLPRVVCQQKNCLHAFAKNYCPSFF